MAAGLAEADAELAPRITPALIDEVVALVPEAWLADEPGFADAQAHRRAYADYLHRRVQSPRAFVEEALHARSLAV